jgi:hypothetical protein
VVVLRGVGAEPDGSIGFVVVLTADPALRTTTTPAEPERRSETPVIATTNPIELPDAILIW